MKDVWTEIETTSEFVGSDVVLLYWSLPDEVPTHDFVRKWSSSKTIVLPKVTGDQLELREYHPEMMAPGAFHILEPTVEAPIVPYDRIELAIVPGRLFDLSGNRKGRGKGYYDRLLPHLNCPFWAVAFPDQIVDKLDIKPHDVPVDKIFY